MAEKTIEECLQKLWQCYRWIEKLKCLEPMPEEIPAAATEQSLTAICQKLAFSLEVILTTAIKKQVATKFTNEYGYALTSEYFPSVQRAAIEHKETPPLNKFIPSNLRLITENLISTSALIEIPDDLHGQLWREKTGGGLSATT